MALNAVQFLVWHKILGPEKTILGPAEGQGSYFRVCFEFWNSKIGVPFCQWYIEAKILAKNEGFQPSALGFGRQI